jgi:ribosomal protein S18 acetylase RimI-like enzyme
VALPVANVDVLTRNLLVEIHMAASIKWGMEEEEKNQVAEILYDAFSIKFNPIIGGDRSRSISFIEETLIPSRIVLAVSDDVVLGVAGLDFHNMGYMDTSLRKTWRLLRWGVFRMIFNGWILESKVPENTLSLDSIAVAEYSRGRGVGKLLIDEVIQFARRKGFSKVKLSVINTNPRAKALYEQIGFKVIKVENIPFPWNRTFGFSSASMMEFEL